MRKWQIFLSSAAILICSYGDLNAQKERSQSPKQQMKEQAKLQKEREEKIEKELKTREDQHRTIQDKATQKRMKKTARKSRRVTAGRNVPFYKRWFGGKRPACQ